jgi:hypothetical protein
MSDDGNALSKRAEMILANAKARLTVSLRKEQMGFENQTNKHLFSIWRTTLPEPELLAIHLYLTVQHHRLLWEGPLRRSAGQM